MPSWQIITDDARLATELEELLGIVQVKLAPVRVAAQPISVGMELLREGMCVGVVVAHDVPDHDLVALGNAARAWRDPAGPCVVLALVASGAAALKRASALGGDLAIGVVGDVGAAIALISVLAQWAGSVKAPTSRGLERADRVRLQLKGDTAEDGGTVESIATSERSRGDGRWVSVRPGWVGWAATASDAPTLFGRVRDVALALQALERATRQRTPRPIDFQIGNRPAAREILFGPARTLSDPASKAVLQTYGLPLPLEELCTSASRAAAESARIGFPVRIALASPDLRLWDHPDLCVEGVDSAARAREAFRQLVALAQERDAEARILGVMVTAAGLTQALLHIKVTPAEPGIAVCDVGFADPHGYLARDTTATVLPASTAQIMDVLERLHGRALLLGAEATRRQVIVDGVTDALNRTAKLALDCAGELESIEYFPLAVLLTGRVEIWTAGIRVTSAFTDEALGFAVSR